MAIEFFNLPDGDMLYVPDFLTAIEADGYLCALQDNIQWEQHQIMIFGRRRCVPRLSAWHGDPEAHYRYSGLALAPQPWTVILRRLKSRIEADVDAQFNSVLLNKYRDGQDSMGWHSDDEAELGSEPTIASLSLGGPRRFLLRHKGRKDLAPVEVPLNHGTLVVMRGPTQAHWQHQVPKTKRPVAARINLTFRRIIGKGSKACRAV